MISSRPFRYMQDQMETHLAAVSLAKGQPSELQTRPTPKPAPDEILIAVKSVALNPADVLMRDQGLFIPNYPTVLGFDMSGLVLEVGDNVPAGNSDDDRALSFRPGITRVAAYAASVWRSCDPNYGPFQERCLVPWQHAVPLPDDRYISWNQAATLPVSVQVPLSAWDAMGIPRVTGTPASAFVSSKSTASEPTDFSGASQKTGARKREVLLIWGASSSVGTMGVQSARILRDDPGSSFAAVFATAGSANIDYVASLGADRVFDHADGEVVNSIVLAAKGNGLVIRHCFLATGHLAPCQAVLQAFLGEREEMEPATIASAPIIPLDAEAVEGVETIFVMPSMADEERLEQFRYWYGTWLREHLSKGTIRPSPKLRVMGKGLGCINAALDELLRGVSCTKLVVEVAA